MNMKIEATLTLTDKQYEDLQMVAASHGAGISTTAQILLKAGFYSVLADTTVKDVSQKTRPQPEPIDWSKFTQKRAQ